MDKDIISIPSPNFDSRSGRYEVDLLVIHAISLPPGKFGNNFVEKFFTNQLDPRLDPYFSSISNLKLSSHCYIKRDGQIIQFVPFDKRAWHAGESSFNGRNECNDYSIGIELEGTDDINFIEVQYNNLAKLIVKILNIYPKITKDRIVGHSDIAPNRKTDPGPCFNWNYLFNLINQFDRSI